MKILVLTACLGEGTVVASTKQEGFYSGINPVVYNTVDEVVVTDKDFPPRLKAMTSRLQAKIPKMLGYQLYPGYDYYIWKDANISFQKSNTADWLVSRCGFAHAAFFRHSARSRIQDEADFIEQVMARGDPYLVNRYSGEPMQEQVKHYKANPLFSDNRLFECGVFVYKKEVITKSAPNILEQWFYHCARWSVNDQLSLPYVLSNNQDYIVNTIDKNIFGNEYTFYHSAHRKIT